MVNDRVYVAILSILPSLDGPIVQHELARCLFLRGSIDLANGSVSTRLQRERAQTQLTTLAMPETLSDINISADSRLKSLAPSLPMSVRTQLHPVKSIDCARADGQLTPDRAKMLLCLDFRNESYE